MKQPVLTYLVLLEDQRRGGGAPGWVSTEGLVYILVHHRGRVTESDREKEHCHTGSQKKSGGNLSTAHPWDSLYPLDGQPSTLDHGAVSPTKIQNGQKTINHRLSLNKLPLGSVLLFLLYRSDLVRDQFVWKYSTIIQIINQIKLDMKDLSPYTIASNETQWSLWYKIASIFQWPNSHSVYLPYLWGLRSYQCEHWIIFSRCCAALGILKGKWGCCGRSNLTYWVHQCWV